MKTHIYLLRCITNLHAGSGDSGQGVIDKMVQRDPADNFPTVHSSSLKGALREHFEKNLKADSGTIDKLFGAGTQKNEKNKEGKFSTGALIFGPARLISLPVRSDKSPFFNVTSYENIQHFLEAVELHKATGDANWKRDLALIPEIKDSKVFETRLNSAALEEESILASFLNMEESNQQVKDQKTWRLSVQQVLGEPFAVTPHPIFNDFANDLPVIARNQLENGESKNLWYEEVVPREARFFFTLKGAEDDLNTFKSKVDQTLVQIGGNATVGYGQTLFTHLA